MCKYIWIIVTLSFHKIVLTIKHDYRPLMHKTIVDIQCLTVNILTRVVYLSEYDDMEMNTMQPSHTQTHAPHTTQ